MRIGFLGNQNNYPFILARALRRLGHEVRVVIDRPERLDRPESRYADITYPYPDWIAEVAPVEIDDVVFETCRWRTALDCVRDCDAVVLNKYFHAAASELRMPAVCFGTGGDIEFGASFDAVEPYANAVESVARDRTWVRSAFALTGLDAQSIRDWLSQTPAPVYRGWRKHVYRRFIGRQRAGLRKAVAIQGFPEGVSPVGDEVVRSCLGSRARRLTITMADVAWIQPMPLPTNPVLRLFNASRILWQRPFPPLVGDWESKGTDVLLRGLHLWHQRTGRRFDLQLVEKGHSVVATKHLISEMGLGCFVRWRPELSQREVFDEYVRADVVVDQLGAHVVGMAGYEAMACGRPVLADARAELYEPVIGKAAPVASARTPDEVAQRLERLCEVDYRRELGAAGRRYVTTYLDPERAAAIILDVVSAERAAA